MGFDQIVVYSHDAEDRQNELLEAIASHDERVRWVEWCSVPDVSPQVSAYNDLLRQCATPWITFVDIDEFVVPLEDQSIHAWLATVPADVSTVHVNWRGFGSSGVVSPDYDLVTRTFERAAVLNWSNHCHFKSFARVAAAQEASVHNITVHRGRRTLSDFQDFETYIDGLSSRVVYDRIQINHYQCKTFPEFQERMRRGSAVRPVGNQHRSKDGSLERFMELDRNDQLDRSIRRFDAAVDECLKRIKDIVAQVTPKAGV
nr:glycosyltransferase family 2 protein [Rhodoblastus sp.]